MEKWIKEIVEQICIGQVLLESNMESGNRLSLITVDNGVEFALKFYCSHNSLLSQGDLNSNDAFKKAIGVLTPSKISSDDAKDIMQYHNHRNTLYHGAKLTTITDRYVADYIELAKKLLAVLFSYSLTTSVWKTQVNQTRKSLIKQESLLDAVSFEEKIVDNQKLVQMKVSSTPMITESILLIIHGFNTMFARPPNTDEVEKSLRLSGVPITTDALSVKISQLRSGGSIEKGILIIKSPALDKLKKKFLF